MKNTPWLPRLAAVVCCLAITSELWAEPRNLGALKEEIVAYVDSGAYERELAAAAAPAAQYIAERAVHRAPGERLVLVLDIDETVLSNLPTMRENDFGYVVPVWAAWVERADAQVIAPMLTLFQAARKAGVEVIFITGRRERHKAVTEKNLRAVGLGDYASLVLTPDDSKDTSEKFKTETRRKIVAGGGVIIANIGDQESDLAGGFAERTFKLPDPFYITK